MLDEGYDNFNRRVNKWLESYAIYQTSVHASIYLLRFNIVKDVEVTLGLF